MFEVIEIRTGKKCLVYGVSKPVSNENKRRR